MCLLWNYKTLIIQVSRNVLLFPSIEWFASIFAFFVGNRLKNSQNIPFWECYSISSYWFVCIRFSVFLRKTLKRQVLSDFVLVFGLVYNSPKKKLKLTFLIILFYHIIALNFPEFWHLNTCRDEWEKKKVDSFSIKSVISDFIFLALKELKNNHNTRFS